MSRYGSIAERLWSQIERTENCWLWHGPVRGRYGHIYANGKNRAAHRIAYGLTFGPIPDGLLVLHHCDNPVCVRPDHLFLGTARDNTLDMYAKGRAWVGDRHWTRRFPEQAREICAAMRARKATKPLRSSCRGRGHEFTPENTLIEANGKRHCRACKRIAYARRAAA